MQTICCYLPLVARFEEQTFATLVTSNDVKRGAKDHLEQRGSSREKFSLAKQDRGRDECRLAQRAREEDNAL